MTRRAARQIECPREPIGLSLEEAATYAGMSTTLFWELVEEGCMPRPRAAHRRRIWIADEVRSALLRLPAVGGDGALVQDGAADDPYDDRRIRA